jgi:hypothetical protein
MLRDLPLPLSDESMTSAAAEFVAAGRARFSTVYCFDFVPSDYDFVWRMLAALPPCRFCEWGSGFGIITGLAEMLGFEACGIEFDEGLATASRTLLADFHLRSPIIVGDYFTSSPQADIYFVYCWPGKIVETEEAFERQAPPGAKLLISYGLNDFRCMTKRTLAEGPSVN